MTWTADILYWLLKFLDWCRTPTALHIYEAGVMLTWSAVFIYAWHEKDLGGLLNGLPVVLLAAILWPLTLLWLAGLGIRAEWQRWRELWRLHGHVPGWRRH